MADQKNRDDSVSEEALAFGKRVKGAAKDAAGNVTGNASLEREGERENAKGAPVRRETMSSRRPMASRGHR